MNARVACLVAGALIVIVALFAPAMSLPLLGDKSWLSMFHVESGAIALAVVVLLRSALISRRDAGLWFSSAMIASLAIWMAYNLGLRMRMAEMLGEIGEASPLTKLAVDSVSLRWGTAILAIGVLVIVGATALVHREPAEGQVKEANKSLLEFPHTAILPVFWGVSFAVFVIAFVVMDPLDLRHDRMKPKELRESRGLSLREEHHATFAMRASGLADTRALTLSFAYFIESSSS